MLTGHLGCRGLSLFLRRTWAAHFTLEQSECWTWVLGGSADHCVCSAVVPWKSWKLCLLTWLLAHGHVPYRRTDSGAQTASSSSRRGETLQLGRSWQDFEEESARGCLGLWGDPMGVGGNIRNEQSGSWPRGDSSAALLCVAWRWKETDGLVRTGFRGRTEGASASCCPGWKAGLEQEARDGARAHRSSTPWPPHPPPAWWHETGVPK